MNRTELRMGTPVILDDIALTPIERVEIVSTGTAEGLWCHATKAPIALAVSGPGEPYALSLDATGINLTELSLTELCRQLPELEAWLRHGDVQPG